MAKYNKSMDILRGIGILLVILGHSLPETNLDYPAHQYIHKLIYSFHMPLFFLISGFFAVKIYQASSFGMYIDFIKDKFKRLLIPYFTITIAAIPIKLLFSRYTLRLVTPGDLLKGILIFPYDGPVLFFWFIYTLFLIFLTAPLLCKIPLKYLLPALLIMYLLPVNYGAAFNANEAIRYSLYFFLGILLNKFYQKYIGLASKGLISIFLILALLALNYIDIKGVTLPSLALELTKAFIGMSLFINLSHIIKHRRIGGIFEYIGKYSFDIYLLSWFFQTGSRVVFYQILKLDYNIVVLLMFAAQLLSVVLSKLVLRKYAILNRLLLGNYKAGITACSNPGCITAANKL